jgi:hypothetical protein
MLASTGVFVRVVCALKRCISCASQTPSTILTYLRHRKSHRHQKMGLERGFYEGWQCTKEHNANREVVDLIQYNNYIIELVSGARE